MNNAFFAYEMPRIKSGDVVGRDLLPRSAPADI